MGVACLAGPAGAVAWVNAGWLALIATTLLTALIAACIGVIAIRRRHRALHRLATEIRVGGTARSLTELAPLLHDRGDATLNTLAEAAHEVVVLAHQRAAETQRLEREMETRVDEESRRVRAQLSHLSLTDALTGLANRRGFDERVRELVAIAHRRDEELALLAVDVDHFKKLNDTCGHHKGDEALVALGEVVQRCIREHDLAGRIGGDEIMIALPRVSPDQAATVANRLIDQFATHPSGLGTEIPWPTLSVGIAMRGADAADDATALRQMADRALYESKHRGRAQVTRWRPELQAMSQAG
ncbi:MAG: GGDEF domain-containing protein [Planctomycetota bacterium]